MLCWRVSAASRRISPRLPEVNRRGPRLYGTLPELPTLDLDAFQAHIAAGAFVVDAAPDRRLRAPPTFPAALSIELRPVFASWLGWLVERATGRCCSCSTTTKTRASWFASASTVGYENLVGALDGGMTHWRDADLPVDVDYLVVGPDALDGTVIDVRQRTSSSPVTYRARPTSSSARSRTRRSPTSPSRSCAVMASER